MSSKLAMYPTTSHADEDAQVSGSPARVSTVAVSAFLVFWKLPVGDVQEKGCRTRGQNNTVRYENMEQMGSGTESE